jgi:hypothetical protein
MKHEPKDDDAEFDPVFDVHDIKPSALARYFTQAMKRDAMRKLQHDKRKAAAEEEEDEDYSDASDDSEIGEEMAKLADLKDESGSASPIPVRKDDLAKSTAQKLEADLAAARGKVKPRKSPPGAKSDNG